MPRVTIHEPTEELNTAMVELNNVRLKLAAAKTAWRMHHDLNHASWGWTANHATLKKLVHDLELEEERWLVAQAHLNHTSNDLFR